MITVKCGDLEGLDDLQKLDSLSSTFEIRVRLGKHVM